MSTKVDTSKWVLGKDFYDWNDDISISMLSNGYLLPHENIPLMFKRVSKAAAKRLKRKDLQPYFFEAFEKNWLCGASPVLSNMGTERGLPISCFGVHIEDSIEGIASANSELMKLSSQGGGVGMYAGDIRPTGSPIKDNGISEGVIPWLKIYDSTTLATNQGSVRRGATAYWLPIEHKDIHDFLKIRQPKGDPNRQTLNSHHGVVISDEFMEKVENKDPEAIKLWGELLKTRLEKGEPYIMFKGNSDRGLPDAYKRNSLSPKFSNICSEILLHTDPLHSFICCLSSLNIAKYDEWKDYKFANEMDLPELACWFLEGVLQEFIDRAKHVKFMENTVRSAVKGRAIGIGILGWHTYLQSKNLPFASIASTAIRKNIQKHIYDSSIKASQDQAKLYGEPEWCKGTGLRHTHHIAIAPTASNAHISGGISPSIEPIPANIYNLKTAKGTFIKKNPYLEKLLQSKGYNTHNVWKQIEEDNGSVLGLPEHILSKDEKEIFLTFNEINQLEIVKQTAAAYQWVDQAVSLNLNFDPNDPPKWISQVHKEAWKLGIKTLYYLRSKSVLRGDSINNDRLSDCLSCEG